MLMVVSWLLIGASVESVGFKQLPTSDMVSAADRIIGRSRFLPLGRVRLENRAKFYSLIPRLGADYVAVSFIGPQANKRRGWAASSLPESRPPGRYLVEPNKLPNRYSAMGNGCYYYVAIVNIRARSIYSETCS